MKMLRVVFMFFMAWTFFIGQAVAGQGNSFSDNSTAIKREHQFLADQIIQQTGGKVRIKTHSKTGNVNYVGVDPANAIRQPSILSANPTPEEAARGFLSVYGPLFGLKEQAQELKMKRSKTAGPGMSSVRFQQIHSGVPILGGELIVQTDSSNNIISAHSKILSDIDIDTTPAITAEEAGKTALDTFAKTYESKYTFDTSAIQISKPELWIYNPLLLAKSNDAIYLVWRMEVTTKEMLPIKELILVDAQSGNVVLHFNQIDGALNRKIFDHNNIYGKSLPGNDPGDVRRVEGGAASGIADVDNAYDFAGDTYNFYWTNHGRDSINGAGMQLISTTRYCPGPAPYYCPYANAFWNGSQMVYGQGYASADDVVAHEMTHGVTDYESNLIYLNQSGAINETFSDVWGEFVDLTNAKGNDSSTVRWLMGEDLPIGAIRSMSNPPAFGDPDRMWSSNYFCGEIDNGGVHWNSGVGNKAAYLMTDGGTFNTIPVVGLGITKVAKIFYYAQANLLITSSDYEDLAHALHQACLNLVGTAGITLLNCQQVDNAIMATEMDQPPSANVLVNGDFESGPGVGWTEVGTYGIITDDTYYNGVWGPFYAWLAGYDDALDRLYQTITIPSNATQAYLQFAWGVDTSEDPAYGAWDYLYILITNPSTGAILANLGSLSNLNYGGWYYTPRIDLLSFRGQTIRLEFYATNDYSLPTSFLIDDVVLVVSAPTPPAATQVSPSGSIGDTTPTYTWNAAAGAMWYQLYVNDLTGNKIQRWYTAAEAGCLLDSSVCSVTPTTEVIGSCIWYVQAYNSAGFGPWSLPGMTFATPIPTPPVAATQVSPTGAISDATPTYTWNAVSNSTWYWLYVNDSTGNRINQWYTAAQAGCGGGVGPCSVTPTTDVRGAGIWYIRTYNSVGYGPWSLPGMSFTAPTPSAPGAATQVSPTGGIGDTTPPYIWNAVATATWYQLYVNDSTGNRIQRWYAAAEVGCPDGVGTCLVTPTTEVRGAGIWYVQTYNSGGLGPWSLPGMSFTAPTPSAPVAATQVSPTGTISDTTPTYTWTPVANATWYQLYVNDSTGNRIQQWYAAADAGCPDGLGGFGACTVTPSTVLAAGAGIWYVQTYNSGGLGPWSLPGMSFTVSP